MNIRQLDIDLTGMESEWSGWWASYQFDNAVIWFGSYIENKLTEMDDKGKPVWKLEDFLEDNEGKRIDRSLEEARGQLKQFVRQAKR